jgi:hypothetical protein
MVVFYVGISITVLLLILTIGFALRQVADLQGLEVLEPEEHQYRRQRAYRRLIGCFLLAGVASCMSGLLYHLADLDRVLDRAAQAQQEDTKPKLTEEEAITVRSSLWYMLSLFGLLILVVMLAMLDMIATRRFGMRQRAGIREDRRALLDRLPRGTLPPESSDPTQK